MPNPIGLFTLQSALVARAATYTARLTAQLQSRTAPCTSRMVPPQSMTNIHTQGNQQQVDTPIIAFVSSQPTLDEHGQQ